MQKEILHEMRLVYNQSKLVEFPSNPFDLFSAWFHYASKTQKEVNGFCLSTCDQNKPSSRIVLLKSFDPNGFVFFTNYESRKGKQLAANPQCTMNFWWDERQIRIEGIAEKLTEKESTDYFLSRPKASQIGAWVSRQSTLIENRDVLDKAEKDLTQRFEKEPIYKPEYWGGYIIKPDMFEFWQGRPSRLHDRIVYERKDGGWTIGRLSP